MRTRNRIRTAPLVALALLGLAALAGAAAPPADAPRGDLSVEIQRRLARAAGEALAWYERTPPGERVAWGGLGACAALGLCAALERFVRLRRRAVVPNDFLVRFLDKLHEGKLDGGKALDYCEMHPSPAARVALAAVRRWGRPAVDLERAVGLANRWESERLRRNVGTLRRVAALAPLLGLLGSLLTADRLLRQAGPGAGASTLADALTPLTCGVAVGVAAMVLYDFLSARVERLAAALDRLGAETIDAVAMTTVVPPPTLPASPPPTPHIRIGEPPLAAERRPVVVVPVREPAGRRFRDDPSRGA